VIATQEDNKEIGDTRIGVGVVAKKGKPALPGQMI
jgi:hypothetical protein